MSKFIRRGEIWLANLSPIVGHEQAGQRPALIISSDHFNQGPDELVAIVPLTTKERSRKTIDQILIKPADSGLRYDSFILPYQLRIVSHDRLSDKIGAPSLPDSFLRAVEYHIGMILQLPVEEPEGFE